MRFIGNKEKLLEYINNIMLEYNIEGETFFDFFSGTSNVAKYFKKKNYKIISSDLLYFSYVLQSAYIKNNSEPLFEKLYGIIPQINKMLFDRRIDNIIEYLNSLRGEQGFIYNNYTPGGTCQLELPRLYFSDENGMKIDAVRREIEHWKNSDVITENEYFILLACLIESVPYFANISGVYAAFLKKWDPRALKPFKLLPIQIIEGKEENCVYNVDSMELIDKIKCDILYLDPPYNGRQYAPNYHLLETIARYDEPEIKGISGMREYKFQKSQFCNKDSALLNLEKILKSGCFKILMLSYNTEGIMPQEEIVELMKRHGEVNLIEIDYLRFKSNNNGSSKHKKYIKEQLYLFNK